MSNLKKKISLILSVIMIALAIFPLAAVTASSNTDDVTMSVKLNGKTEMQNQYEYKVKNGEKINVSAKSTTGSTIAFIGYYYFDEGVDSCIDVKSDSLTITVPTQPVGTEKLLVIEAVAEANRGKDDPTNRTGWQFYYLKWVSDEAQTVEVDVNARYNGLNLADRSTTTTAKVGDDIDLVATPAENAQRIYYRWDDESIQHIDGAKGTIKIPSTFAAGSTHYLYVLVRDIKGNDKEQKIYKFIIPGGSSQQDPGDNPPEDNPPAIDPSDDELEILPWEKENKDLDTLAVALRNDSESKKKNKNVYALDEEVTYYVDYKNGGKDITDKVVLKLELPLKYKVIDADGGVINDDDSTITWTFNGMEEDQDGTKVVKMKYTGFDKKSTEYETVYPLATIAKDTKVVDKSAVINLIYEDEDTVIDETHTPYMYGDRDTPTFRPNDTITRAEGALVLTRILLGQRAIDNVTVKSVYPDLDETYEEAQKAIIAATSYGIINGYTDGYYRPNTTMTRAEFMKILAKFIEINAEDEGIDGLEIKALDNSVKVYKDNKRYVVNGTELSAHWALEEVTLLTRLNMTGAKENKDLRLDENITRAEVAQLVNFFTFRAPAETNSRTTSKFTDVNRYHELFGDIIEATRATHDYSYTEDGTEKAE